MRGAHHGGRAHRRSGAARPGLENVQRLTTDDGATYVGQAVDGKRQGLGVAELKDGDRQAGEWQDNVLNGLGIERLADGPRYEGQWRAGVPAGPGTRDRPEVDPPRDFASGRQEGLGMRRKLSDPGSLQLRRGTPFADGPGRGANGERATRAASAPVSASGQVVGTDDKVQPGRGEDGKPAESVPDVDGMEVAPRGA